MNRSKQISHDGIDMPPNEVFVDDLGEAPTETTREVVGFLLTQSMTPGSGISVVGTWCERHRTVEALLRCIDLENDVTVVSLGRGALEVLHAQIGRILDRVRELARAAEQETDVPPGAFTPGRVPGWVNPNDRRPEEDMPAELRALFDEVVAAGPEMMEKMQSLGVVQINIGDPVSVSHAVAVLRGQLGLPARVLN
jgi:hypothetical protein